MKRALFIIPQLLKSPQRLAYFQIIKSVADCQVKVRVLTSFDEDDELPDLHKNIEILRPFRSWSLFEIPNIVRAIYGFPVDIVHFVYDPACKISGTLAMAIPGVIQTFSRPQFIFHLQGQFPEKLNSLMRFWLKMSNCVLVEDDFTKLRLSALPESHRRQTIHVVASSWNHALEKKKAPWVSQHFDHYVYCCGEVSTQNQWQSCIEPVLPFLRHSEKHGVVLSVSEKLSLYSNLKKFKKWINKNKLQSQVVILKSPSAEQNKTLLTHCSMVTMTHLPLGSSILPLTLKMAHQAKKQVIVPRFIFELEKSLKPYLSLAKTPEELKNMSDWKDLPMSSGTIAEKTSDKDVLGNQLNRIYQTLLRPN